MTRINTIDPTLLTDQHLFAEFREITRVSSLARVLPDYGQYCMGTGHVKFFYDKGEYLAKRLEALQAELDARGMNYTAKTYLSHNPGLNNDYEPTYRDHVCNVSRLCEKLSDKPAFYRYYGKPVPADFYSNLYVTLAN